METCDAVCFGTLAQRSRQSRETIWRLLDAARGAMLLFDVNLRLGFYDRESLVESCRRATFVKLNELELPIVAEMLDLSPGPPLAKLSQLFTKFRVRGAVLTRGERGTLLATPDHVFDPPPAAYPAAPNSDAVGAGDACTAGVLVGTLLGWSGERIASFANHLGAYVASQPGATPRLPSNILELLTES
jgi:fructokinase